MSDRISSIIERLEPHDTLNPPDGFWIRSSEGENVYDPDNHGDDFCEECGDDFTMRLNTYTPGDITYELEWSDPGGNFDSIPCCSGCGKTLRGWPTEYCESDELNFFETEDWEPSPENIHIIGMVLSNLCGSAVDKKYEAWAKIGELALAKLNVMEVPHAQ